MKRHFTVTVFVSVQGQTLLHWHAKNRMWLPPGGHIELDEDPEEALFREIREECGLRVRVLASKPDIAHAGVKPVLTPSYVDVHRITSKHGHIAFVYFAVSQSARVTLHEREHEAFRWFSRAEIAQGRWKLS
ncbi:MAG: NUDIX domain-containing protein, partial [Chloroflexi bacterium]|nr:NUDIX domain-containing protein [Chloroflexota bacterium]